MPGFPNVGLLLQHEWLREILQTKKFQVDDCKPQTHGHSPTRNHDGGNEIENIPRTLAQRLEFCAY